MSHGPAHTAEAEGGAARHEPGRPGVAWSAGGRRTASLAPRERLSFFVILVVVGVRPLVSETYLSATPSFVRGLSVATGPGPVLPLAIGSLVLVSAALAAWGLWRGDPKACYRPTGLGVGAMFLASGMVVSLFVAGDRRSALNASSDWLVSIGVCVVLVQLLRRPWPVRLLLCVLVAGAAAFAFQCIMQRFVELPETLADYEARKVEFWREQGIPLDDPKVQLYERRLQARETGGYFPHPNVAGSFLLLSVACATALALARPSPPPSLRFGPVTFVLGGVFFACIGLTGSKGAVLAGVVAAAIGSAWWLATRRGIRSRRLHLVAVWLLMLGMAEGVVYYARHSPPDSSMGFRWAYWRTTALLLRDYFWTGVGAENFGKFYLRYKPITSPEEVRDPHNFFLAAFAQWGVVGAVGLLAMAIGVSRCLARRSRVDSDADEQAAATAGPVFRACAAPVSAVPGARADAAGAGKPALEPMGWRWLAALGGAIFLFRLWTLLGNDPAYVFYGTVAPLIVWLVSAFLVARETGGVTALADEPLPVGTRFVLIVGLLAFLLHCMVDMSLSYPGTITTFFAVLAAAIALSHQADVAGFAEDGSRGSPAGGHGRTTVRPPRHGSVDGRWVAVALAVLWVVHAVVLLWPVARAHKHLETARRMQRFEVGSDPLTAPALQQYRAAINADPLDAAPAAEAAEWVLHRVLSAASVPPAPEERRIWAEADRLAGIAVQRDPYDLDAFRTLISINLGSALRFGSAADAWRAAGLARNAIDLYPQSPQDRVLLAEAFAACGRLDSTEAGQSQIAAAIAEYERALDLDAARPGKTELRRWPPHVRRNLEARIESLKAILAEPAVSQPTTETAPVGAAPVSYDEAGAFCNTPRIAEYADSFTDVDCTVDVRATRLEIEEDTKEMLQ